MQFRPVPMPRDQMALIPMTLGDLIATDHPIRLFDELLDQLDFAIFEPEYRIEKRGQPPIPPRIIVAVLLFGIHREVRSSRKLEYQLINNVEFMWLAHGHRIDHTTLSKFRKQHREAIKQLHRELVKFAKQMGVVKLGELYVDGTRIRADASRSKTLTAEKVERLLDQLDAELEQRLTAMEANDEIEELFDNEQDGERLPVDLRDLQQRQAELQRILKTCRDADAERKKQGIDPSKTPFQLPVADQDSRILPNKEGGYAPNYTPMIGVEGELGLIVTTCVINSPNEQDQLVCMVDDVQASYGVNVEIVGADGAYSIVTNVAELELEREIDFLSPDRKGDVLTDNPAIREDPSRPVASAQADQLPVNPSTKKFDSQAFVYDLEADTYYCPQGRKLHRIGSENNKQRSGKTIKTAIYQCETCEGCPLLTHCRNGSDHKAPRRVRRDEYEELRQSHRKKMSDPEVKKRYAKRFEFGERPFGHIKRNFGFRRFTSRGQDSVESEWSMIATGYNLLRLMKFFGSTEALRAHLSKMKATT